MADSAIAPVGDSLTMGMTAAERIGEMELRHLGSGSKGNNYKVMGVTA